MISLEDILELHRLSIVHYGGAVEIRDITLVESAIHRPYQTFAGVDLYPSILEKAAAVGESIIKNHPFLDGNKRTGFLAMVAFLEVNGYQFNATQDEAYRFTILISTGETNIEDIVSWLKENTTPL